MSITYIRAVALEDLIRLADNLRTAQKAYMENRGSLEHGRAVAEAARRYDEARAKIILGPLILERPSM